MNGYAVTSFSQAGYQRYGERFIDTFLQHWPIPLVVFGEGQVRPEKYANCGRELLWMDLKDDPEHEDFCTRYAAPKFNSKTDFNMMSVKFGHKVFAITSPKLPENGWRVWIDADSETKKPVTREHIGKLFPDQAGLTFLGRKGFMRPGQPCYTECGFVGYNTKLLGVRVQLAEMREIYTTGKLF